MQGILEGSVTDVFEIDAASNNSVDNVRELREDVIYTPALVKYKVYIIDEVHRMSGPAFDALLKTIEEPPSHVIFILATTELHKVPATILSRCQRFDFRRIDAPDIADRLQYVAACENIDLTEEAAAMLARMGQGSMRDALSLLERATALEGRVDAAAVGDLLGLCDPHGMLGALKAMAAGDTASVLRFLNDMWRASKDISRLLSEMAVLLRDAALVDVAPDLVAASRSAEETAALKDIMQTMGKGRLLYSLETLQKGMRDIALTADSRVMTEITLMRMCDPKLTTAPASLVARVEALEKGAPPTLVQKEAPPVTESVPLPEPPPIEPPAPKKTPAPAATPVDQKNWQVALDVLRQGGRQDVLAMLMEHTPTIEGDRLVFAVESGFTRMRLEQEAVRNAILDAMKKADGKTYTMRFVDPGKPKMKAADPMDDLLAMPDITVEE